MTRVGAMKVSIDSNGGQEPVRGVRIERDGKACVVLVSERPANEPFERGRRGSGDQQPRGLFNQGWVETDLGVLVRREVTLGESSSTSTTTVDFVPHPRVAVRVPSRMEETFRTSTEFGVGTATYTDVRVFGVSATEQIRKPPPGAR